MEKKLFIAVGLLYKMGFYNGNFSCKMFDYGNETPYYILCVKSPKQGVIWATENELIRMYQPTSQGLYKLLEATKLV